MAMKLYFSMYRIDLKIYEGEIVIMPLKDVLETRHNSLIVVFLSLQILRIWWQVRVVQTICVDF